MQPRRIFHQCDTELFDSVFYALATNLSDLSRPSLDPDLDLGLKSKLSFAQTRKRLTLI